MPFTAAEVAVPPPADPAQNAAPIYARIPAEQERALEQAGHAMARVLRDPELGPKEALRIAAGHAEVTEPIERASLLPYYRPERDLALGFEYDFAELRMLRYGGALLAYRGAAHAQLAQPELAARDLATARRVARHQTEVLDWMAVLTSKETDTDALEETRRAASAFSTSPEGLRLLEEEVLGVGELPVRWRDAMRGTAYAGTAELRKARLLPGQPMPAAAGPQGSASQQTGGLGEARQLSAGGLFGTELLRRAWYTRLLEGWAMYFEAIPESGANYAHFVEAHEGMSSFLDKQGHSYLLAALILPIPLAWVKVQPAYQYRATRAYIDVLQFRNQHGRWPESLEEAGVRVLDPFNGEPLRFRLEGEGFRIWSVGRNARDDNGVTKEDAPDGEADDLAVTYPIPPRAPPRRPSAS